MSRIVDKLKGITSQVSVTAVEKQFGIIEDRA